MSAPSWGQMWSGTVEAVAALACGDSLVVLRPVARDPEEPDVAALLGPSVYEQMVQARGWDPLVFRDLAARWAS